MAVTNLFPSRLRAPQPCATILVYFALLFTLALESASPATLAAAAVVPAAAPVAVPAPAPAPKILTLHEKVVGSLRGAGNYGAIAGLLDSFPNNIVKAGMTLFAPNDIAFSNVQMNSTKYLETLLSYHASTQVYSFQGLLNLPAGTKIPTSAPNVFIVVTSATKVGYKVDDSGVVDPDIFADQTVSVHGIDSVLNTAKYNKGVVAPEAAPAPANIALPPVMNPGPPAPPASDGTPGSPGESMSPSESTPQTANPNDASSLRLSTKVMALWIVLVCLAL